MRGRLFDQTRFISRSVVNVDIQSFRFLKVITFILALVVVFPPCVFGAQIIFLCWVAASSVEGNLV